MEIVSIGKIVNTRGLKGEVKCIFYSDFIEERFKKNNKVFVFNEDNVKTYLTVKSYKINKDILYAFFEEIDHIDKATKLKNREIFIDTKTLQNLKEDEFYYFQLLNLSVIYKSKEVGIISEVFSNGKHDLIRVSKDEKSFLCPFIDHYIENIDLEKNQIVLKDLGGLYENWYINFISWFLW